MTFTPTDTANYTTATATTSITVLQGILDINWPPPGDVTYGTPLGDAQLNAGTTGTNALRGTTTTLSGSMVMAASGLQAATTASVVAAGTFTYQPPAGTILNAGTHTLTVTFTPQDRDNYAISSRSVLLRVLKARPTLAWPAPDDVTLGMMLSAAQLKATANVPGTLSYSPPLGALLDEGTRTLAVAFTPADVTNFTGAMMSTTVRIARGPAPPQPAPPFGAIDTPADNGTGVVGSLGITGWALADVGIAAVEIYRDPMPGEGVAPVFLGTAALIEGVRPDVQAAYPALPFASRAGWGYMLLTNMLPNHGDGTYRILAYARDLDGRSTLLGARRFTCANSAAVVPFGAIDTPGQGEVVSGAILNFGWALTPQPNSIPVDGSTIDVLVDGVVLGHPVYGFERGDITSMFPGYANTKTAVGYFPLDTRQMTNGLHTIAWIVRDTAGHVQGIGSRFFTIRNEVIVNNLVESMSVPVVSAPETPLAAKPAASSTSSATTKPTVSTPVIGVAPVDPIVPQVTARREQIGLPVTTTAPAATAPSMALPTVTLVAPPASAKTHASLTVSATTVTAGGTIAVTIENGPAAVKDRVMFYSSTTQRTVNLDWKYLNGERTAPAGGLSTAVVTLTAPSTPGRYVVRLMSGTASDAIATSDVIVVAPPMDPKNTSRIQK